MEMKFIIRQNIQSKNTLERDNMKMTGHNSLALWEMKHVNRNKYEKDEDASFDAYH